MSGFRYRTYSVEDGWAVGFSTVVLPRRVVTELVEEDEERARLAEVGQEEHASEPQASHQSQECPPRSTEDEGDSGAADRPQLQILSLAEVSALEASAKTRNADSDLAERNRGLAKLVRRRGEYRKLATLSEGWRRDLDRLEGDFPNFGAVIDYLRGAFALCERADRAPKFDPILLDGPPGIGKSLFAQRLASSFASGFCFLDMASCQAGAVLSGSQEFWANTQPGEVFNWLIEKDYANPTFYLDELDKAAASAGERYDSVAPLHQLLEPAMARSFRDLSYPQLSLDASRINWIATSNDAQRLPPPILDRMRVFPISGPTPAQSRDIARQIYAELRLETVGPCSFDELSRAVVRKVAQVSPRRMKRVLRDAMGRALYRGRSRLLPRDIELLGDGGGQRPIGFL